MATITLEGLQKTYPNGHVAARGLDLEIGDGEFVVLVGPSGSGKSTALRMIAGLETPTGGRILVGGEDVTSVPPQERDLAMVFQSYALYPHKTVRENLAFPLRMRRRPAAVIDERVRAVAETLGIEPLLERRPAQLSGGQRQRVALGRALVREPRAFLFDEPLSNLDPSLRARTRAELALLHRRLGATMVYVTHDQEEAMTLGDRIAIMKDGALQQVAAPMEVYRRPANAFVAAFIGSPAMNLFDCTTTTAGGASVLRTAAFDIELPRELPSPAARVGIRPQDTRLLADATDREDVGGTVEVVEVLGSEQRVYVRLHHTGEGSGRDESETIIAMAPIEQPLEVEQRVGLGFPRDSLHLFDAEGSRMD